MSLLIRTRDGAVTPFRRTRFLVGFVLAGALWFLFCGIVQDLMVSGPLVTSDARMAAFLETLRSPGMNQIMVFLTDLGSWQVVTAGASAFGALLFLRMQSWWGFALVAAMIGEQALSQGLKHLFHRLRPDFSTWLVTASGGSFPSGHTLAGATFYGFVACYVICQTRNWTMRVLIAVTAVALILGIAVSRVYLGVHWPSDALGALALGPAWLATVFLVFNSGRLPIQFNAPAIPAGWRPILAIGVWVTALATIFLLTNPLIRQTTLVAPPVQIGATEFDINLFNSLPRFKDLSMLISNL